MHVSYHIFGLTLASYGTLITIGVLLANLIASRLMKKEGDDYNNMLLLEAYGLIGGMIGAKLLYFILSFQNIRWDLLSDPAYFHALVSKGFVFYGGLIGGLVFAFLSGKIHKFDSASLLNKYIFLIPFSHAFGRIGCFMAGCCYGIPYDGPLSVLFPENGFAPAGIPLFPIQLLESFCLFVLSLALYHFSIRKRSGSAFLVYLITYGILRFFLEYLRGDAVRGQFGIFSTSQWISLLLAAAACILWRNKKRGCHS